MCVLCLLSFGFVYHNVGDVSSCSLLQFGWWSLRGNEHGVGLVLSQGMQTMIDADMRLGDVEITLKKKGLWGEPKGHYWVAGQTT